MNDKLAAGPSSVGEAENGLPMFESAEIGVAGIAECRRPASGE